MKSTYFRAVLIVSVLVIAILATDAVAQLRDQVELREISRGRAFGMEPAATPFSLIDLSRVRWSRSYSASFYSGGGNSASIGHLNNTMFYDLSSKLSLALNFGLSHNLGGVWGDGTHNAVFLPGFNLDFHPSDKFRLSITYQRIQGYGSGYWPSNHVRFGQWNPF